MKKWDVTLTCKVIATYGIKAETARRAEEIAKDLFDVKVERYDPDQWPEVLSFCEDYEDKVEEVTEWTGS